MAVTNYPREDYYESELAQDISETDLSLIAQDAVQFDLSSGTFSLYIDNDKPSKRERVIVTALDATKKIFTITRAANVAEGVAGVARTHTAGAKLTIAPGFADFKTLVDEKADKDAPTISDLTVTGYIDLPTYADATARDAAIPSPEEGYVVVLLDDGDGNRAFSVYDGSDWGFIAAPLQDVTIEGFLTVNGPLTVSSDYVRVPVYADNTARDAAIGSPALGMIIWNTTADTMQIYTSGGWDDLDLGTVTPLASQTVPGKVELATDQQALDRDDTDGPNPLVVQPSQIDYANEAIFTAAQDLTAGDVVGASNLVSNNIALAARDGNDVAANHGITNNQLASSLNHYAPIGGDKYVYLNYNTTSSDSLFAQVVQIDRDAMDISVGTAATVATAFTPGGTGLPVACVCKLDTDKFIVFYLLDSSTTDIKYRVGTVSGTTITFGTEATFVTAASTVATSNSFCADFLETDKGVFVFKAATTTSSSAVAFTVSGTVATAGTPVGLGANSQANGNSTVKRIATDKFVLVTGSNEYLQVGSISGTTIAMGTEVGVAGIAGNEVQGLISPADDVFVAVFEEDNNSSWLVAATVSGTTITAGTPLEIPGPGFSGRADGIVAIDANTYIVPFGTSSIVNQVTRSGTALTDAGVVINPKPINGVIAVFEMDNGYYIFTDFIEDTEVTAWIEGMSNNFIGVIQNTVSRGDTDARVKFSGVDSNQSGLAPGNIYQVNAGALSLADIESTANDTLSEQLTVTSISDTEILI